MNGKMAAAIQYASDQQNETFNDPLPQSHIQQFRNILCENC